MYVYNEKIKINGAYVPHTYVCIAFVALKMKRKMKKEKKNIYSTKISYIVVSRRPFRLCVVNNIKTIYLFIFFFYFSSKTIKLNVRFVPNN